MTNSGMAYFLVNLTSMKFTSFEKMSGHHIVVIMSL